ncbi:MAG: radical SAM protein [Elusimicrobiota bacterium]
MYDCILINPRSVYYSKEQQSSPYPYAGLLSIGSFLCSKGWETTILDMVLEDDPVKAFDDTIKSNPNQIILVGFSVMTSQISHASQLSKHIKSRYPFISIIWGGIHSSLFPEDVLKSGFVDYVCIGEGEHTTHELLHTLKNKSDVSKVKGLCFLENNKFVQTEPRPCHDLNELPYFNYDIFNYPRYKRRFVYRGKETIEVNFGVMLTSFGCPYRCTFCINSNKNLFFGKYRTKSVQRICDEIEHLITNYSVNFFDFVDEDFFIKRSNIENFISEIKHRKLVFKWMASIRADAFDKKIVDSDMLIQLKDIGCYRLAIGAESGSQQILNKLKKDITVEQIYKSAELITNCGIGTTFSLMMGIPGETKLDIVCTLKMIRRLRSISDIVSIVGPQIFRPYPGGELYDECINIYHYNQPKTVEEWTNSMDILTGFDNIDRLIWINDKNFVGKISFYMDFVNLNIFSLKVRYLKKMLLILMQKISELRMRTQFWYFPIDMVLIMLFKKVKRLEFK